MLKGINLQLFAEGEGTGVEVTAAAGQEGTTGAAAEGITEGANPEGSTEAGKEAGNETGVKGQSAAGTDEKEKVEKAFAARLAKERERLEAELKQKARDEWIAEQGYVWNGKPITTEAEYKQALYEKELQEKGQDPSLIKKLIDEHPDVKAARELRQKIETEERQRKEFREFVEAYPDVKPEDIPIEVWEQNSRGIPLRYAYADYALKQLKAEQTKAKANAQNAANSTGSVTSNGDTGDDFISYETFQKNRENQDWVNKNFSKIMKSRAKW